MADLEPEQVAAIKEWHTHFEKQYKYMGKVIGTQCLLVTPSALREMHTQCAVLRV